MPLVGFEDSSVIFHLAQFPSLLWFWWSRWSSGPHGPLKWSPDQQSMGEAGWEGCWVESIWASDALPSSGWQCGRWCGERTQAAVVESLQRSAQTTSRPSFLLLDTGLGRVGVSVPRVQVLREPGWEEWGTSGLWLPPAGLWRDAGISSSFSCTEAVFYVVFTSCSFEVEDANTFVALWHNRGGCQGLEGCSWC